jgi:hypothetical protein
VHLHDSSESVAVRVRFHGSSGSAQVVVCAYEGSLQAFQVVLTRQLGCDYAVVQKVPEHFMCSYAIVQEVCEQFICALHDSSRIFISIRFNIYHHGQFKSASGRSSDTPNTAVHLKHATFFI